MMPNAASLSPGCVTDLKACQCGAVLKGVLKPWEWGVRDSLHSGDTDRDVHGVFRGACAAYYHYGRFTRQRVREVVETA